MTRARPQTDIDPEFSVRVRAFSRQCGQLGAAWDEEQVELLYDESERLTERAQNAGIDDLAEALMGLSAYLSSFVDSGLRPNDTQTAQLCTLAEAAADAHARFVARIEVASLGPDVRLPSAIDPTVYYLGYDSDHLAL